jgi:hypothetical protein
MMQSDNKGTAASQGEEVSADRKPYEPPQVRHERVFETMALSCGKVQATQGSCRFNRKAS